jgi:hypothetical protein
MRVLLINQPDDLTYLLKQRGLEVRTADAARALEIAHAFEPDAVVLDDDETAQRLKAVDADRPPLILAVGEPNHRGGVDLYAADAEELVRLLALFA